MLLSTKINPYFIYPNDDVVKEKIIKGSKPLNQVEESERHYCSVPITATLILLITKYLSSEYSN